MNRRRSRYIPVYSGAGTPYGDQILALFGSDIISYLKLSESSGTTAADATGNGRTGTYTNSPTLGAAGIGDGLTSVSFDGTNDLVDWYSTSLRDAFNAPAGSLMGWAKVLNSGVWTDSSYDTAGYLGADGNNKVYITKTTTNYRVGFAIYGGGSYRNVNVYTTSVYWLHMGITWSTANSRVRAYLNGALHAVNANAPYTWTGSIASTRAVIGANNTTPTEPWKGYLAHWLVLNREATQAEMRSAASARGGYTFLGIIGDSIEDWEVTSDNWVAKVRDSHNSGKIGVYNHAVTGQNIMTHMDAQVVAAASDDVDKIIIALGTNDGNTSDIPAMQAECEENIAELKSDHPGASIYWLCPLKRWADNTTGPEEPLGNTRTAIYNACVAQGATYWDSYTDSWILQSETTDGTHPTDAGHVKIATQVKARL